ncbi:hypothetical protein HDF19_00395 [Mucilaginibacter sp. E4BP6]|uniref:hypothetical protein n=1 Tax=Mucilaginibacter sp. E4BP6 TaxID=2723089 RepID=UPI0015C795AE|nr:hypothetical protein [Mucilaginibacter sp. E4BP6]NYE66967.1 hypothetical protein [Mucilaginibacter sp. E4BP6]
MRKRSERKKIYPFAWMDETIEITLNPCKGHTAKLKNDDLCRLKEKFDMDVCQIISYLKSEIFYLRSLKKKKIVVQQYYKDVVLLRNQAAANIEQYYSHEVELTITGKYILKALDELADLIGKRYSTYLEIAVGNDQAKNRSAKTHIFKILCQLSVDQLGIILKAADDAKLVIAQSLSLVFKSIVPYLSTPAREELSWQSMRSSSYHPEERDKELAILALEKMIKEIKQYR